MAAKKNENLIIAFDLGTSGNKATIIDLNGNVIASTFKGYKTEFLFPGWAEQEQNDWWNSVKESTLELLANVPNAKSNLAGISFSGQMMGCCPVNKEGKPLCKSIIWSDNRAYREKEYLNKILTDDFIYKTTGNIVCSNYLASKILWIKNNYPDIYKNTYKFLQAKDYIIYILTGNYYTDYSDASGTNLFDISKKCWNEDIIRTAGISLDKLPEVVSSIHIVGHVKDNIAQMLDLPVGLPVIIGGGDGACATVGAGASQPNSFYNIFGTSSWTSVTTKKPLYDDLKRTFILNHLDPNLYMNLGAMQSAGSSYEWLADWITSGEVDLAKKIGVAVYELMDLEAMKSDPGSKGVIFLPYLMGERSPYWDTEVKGAFLGLTRMIGRKEIIRSVLEGVVYHLKIILDIFEENVGAIKEIRVIGGAARSKILQGLMADIWGKRLVIMKFMEEATSIGAALAGFVGLGMKSNFVDCDDFIKKANILDPDLKKHETYKNYFNIFKEAYFDLKEINNKLDKLLRK